MMDTMDSDENGHLSNDMLIGRSIPFDDSLPCYLLREPEILPRVGASYQVEIPELVQKSEYLSFVKNATNTENGGIQSLMKLPIPVMKVGKTEVLQHVKLVGKERGLENDSHSGISVGKGEVVIEDKLRHCRGQDCNFLPGSAKGSWNDLDKASFLLGAYIFEKKFIQLRRFLESKNMGDILAFYYGNFYRSKDYCRWWECRKMRSRRCVFGHKIFTGLRQQELLSRLLPSVSEECKNALLEVSKTFVEGKMSLEEYVSSLKAMVGMSMLVEAVGIGKGKQDLTGMSLEPLRSNQAIPMRPEIPTGKACSSLTSSEIVKFLTGDYRLSKARSNDLFWEAVWPRLLARGWHSEEAKDQGYAAGSKNPLVFLVPGVKKFSRRRLVKGNHYFDSVSDVLGKVASKPGLIELETEEDENKSIKEENEWKNNRKLEEDGMAIQRRHFYLQPRTPSRSNDGMKLTVIDTSLYDGEPYKVKELRSLPCEISSKFNSRNSFEISDEDSSVFSSEESDAEDTTLANKGENNIANASNNLSNGEMVSDMEDLQNRPPKWENHTDSESVPVNDSVKRKIFYEDKQPKKEVVINHLTQITKEDDVDDICHVSKRARTLAACDQLEKSNVVMNPVIVPTPEPELPSCSLDIHDFVENVSYEVASSQDKWSMASSSKDSHTESVEFDTVHCHAVPDLQKSSQNPILIDLNLPQVPVDFENGILMADGMGEKDDKTRKQEDDDALEMALDVFSAEQHSNLNPQRRSTRNRPPTTRALEALADGFLTVNRRRKGKESISRENFTARSSRRARGVAGLTEIRSNSVDSTVQGSENVACSDGDKVTFSEFEVLPPENGAPFSGN